MKKLYSVVCTSMMNYGCQLYSVQYSLPRETIKLSSIHIEVIRINTGVFRMSPVELLHVESCGPTMKLRRNVGLRFLYRRRINSTYTNSLNTLDDRKPKLCRKQSNHTNKSTPKKTRTRIYEFFKEQREWKRITWHNHPYGL